jgi:hypothetical protein
MTIPFRAIVALAYVSSVPASMRFYEAIGFRVTNTFAPPGESEPVWAWLDCDGASLMIGRASEPVVAAQQAVLFYLYTDDLPGKHAELAAANFAVGEITYPFYAPRGEFRLHDPDDYVLMITHTDIMATRRVS